MLNIELIWSIAVGVVLGKLLSDFIEANLLYFSFKRLKKYFQENVKFKIEAESEPVDENIN